VALQRAVVVTVVLLGRPAVATNGAAEATAKAEAATGHPAVAVVAAAEATVPLWATLMATVRVPTASGSASESPARIVGATVFPSHKLSESHLYSPFSVLLLLPIALAETSA
jgi:hypothetical protein